MAAVLDRFAEVGLIDDAAFARAWVESRHHGRGLARRALSAELRRRGVDPDQTRAAVAAIGADDELATARQLVARRIALSRGKPLPARVRQLVGLLARKGYPASVAYQVVREALAQERSGLAGEGIEIAGDVEDLADQDAAGDEGGVGSGGWVGER